MFASRIGRGSSTTAPSRPLPSGSRPTRATVSSSMPTCTNSASWPSGPITPRAAYRAPSSSRAGLDDPAQQCRQRQVPGHHLARVQQAAQPALGAHHLLGPLDQLAQQLVQLHPREVREGQPARAGIFVQFTHTHAVSSSVRFIVLLALTSCPIPSPELMGCHFAMSSSVGTIFERARRTFSSRSRSRPWRPSGANG